MQVSSQIQISSDSVASSPRRSNASGDGQFAGLVSANSPRSDTSQDAAPRPNTPESGSSQPGEPPKKALVDDNGGTLRAEQPATAVVRPDGEKHEQPVEADSPHAQVPQVRLPVAGDLPEGGKGLPVADQDVADPALTIDVDTGGAAEIVEAEETADTAEGDAAADGDVITLVAEIDVPIVAPAAPAVKGQVQTPVIANSPAEVSSAHTEGDDAAASGDGPEKPAAPGPLRHDAAPRPGELDQLRGGRAQGLAWDQAQQTILAPQRQSASGSAKPSLGEVALAPDTGKEAREGASTAQLLAGGDAGEKSDLKSLKELREARLAATPAVAAKAAPAEATSSPLVDTGAAVRAGSAPTHPAGVAPSSPTDTSLAQLVDRLIETRVAARSERSQVELSHPDFGRVTLAVGLRGDDRLSIDLPGAPTELRHAVGQALAQQGAAQSAGQNAGQNSGQNTGNNGNQSSNQRGDAQGQAAFAGGENSQNSAGHNGGSGNNTYEPDNPHLSIIAQSQSAGSDSGAGKSAGGSELSGRRGVLA